MRQTLSLVLIWLLGVPALSQTSPSAIKTQALSISRDTAVEVRLLDKSRLRGRIGTVSDMAFELQTASKGTVEVQQIQFDRVKSLRPVKDKQDSLGRTVGRTFLITAIVIGTIIAISIAVTYAGAN